MNEYKHLRKRNIKIFVSFITSFDSTIAVSDNTKDAHYNQIFIKIDSMRYFDEAIQH